MNEILRENVFWSLVGLFAGYAIGKSEVKRRLLRKKYDE